MARAQIPSPWPLGGAQDPLRRVRMHHGQREKSSDPNRICWAASPNRTPSAFPCPSTPRYLALGVTWGYPPLPGMGTGPGPRQSADSLSSLPWRLVVPSEACRPESLRKRRLFAGMTRCRDVILELLVEVLLPGGERLGEKGSDTDRSTAERQGESRHRHRRPWALPGWLCSHSTRRRNGKADPTDRHPWTWPCAAEADYIVRGLWLSLYMVGDTDF